MKSSARALDSATPRVVGFVLNVRNLPSAIDSYAKLGFRERSRFAWSGPDFERLVGAANARAQARVLQLGVEHIVLTEFAHPDGRPTDRAARANDLTFQHAAIVVANVDRALAELRSCGDFEVRSDGPQTIPRQNPVAHGVRVVYLRSHDGHFVELLAFPEGKGDARWHAQGRGEFLGIDHSAIVTSNTERSIRFYCERLGLEVDQASLNEGPEQAALSGVANARVRVTRLQGRAGPGIELLEYLDASRGGRRQRRALTEPGSWQTVVEVDDLGRLADLPAVMSAASTPVTVSSLGARDCLARLTVDPDDHIICLLQTNLSATRGMAV